MFDKINDEDDRNILIKHTQYFLGILTNQCIEGNNKVNELIEKSKNDKSIREKERQKMRRERKKKKKRKRKKRKRKNN